MSDLVDIAIIGGGIHGVGVAQAAAAAGYRVVLLEKEALASGTSSRSSKLIHGGLRYLESHQWKLVRESIRERQTLLRIAPELVKLTPFYIPIYKETTRRPWMIRAGLSLYALLGNLAQNNRFRKVPKKEWQGLDGLKQQNLQAVFQYWDAQTDDKALTQAVMNSAKSLGAKLLCPAEFIGADREHNEYLVHYKVADKESVLRASSLVNAAGPWVNDVLGRIHEHNQPLKIDLVQGAHLVLEQAAANGIYYVEAPEDQRAILIMPFGTKTLVGTTEHTYKGDPGDVVPLKEEQDYLLHAMAHYFPDSDRKIIAKFAGLRVLPADGSDTAFNKPRDTILHQTQSHRRCLSIYGGKLTGYRATAEKVVAALTPLLPQRVIQAQTDQLTLQHPDNN